MTQQLLDEVNKARDEALQSQRVCAWCDARFDTYQHLTDHIVHAHPTSNEPQTIRSVFNTGRLYQDDGQIIIALWQDEEVLFNDTSRLIWGKFPLLKQPKTQYDLEFLTMTMYDAGQYAHHCDDARALRRDEGEVVRSFRV